MLRKFLDGLVFGAGFAIAALAVFWIAGGFFFFNTHVTDVSSLPPPTHRPGQSAGSEELITDVPALAPPGRFLDSTASYSGDFMSYKKKVLTGGPGKIVGTAVSNGVPVEGLKLRLALNGSAMSQWAVTDASGKYTVTVPYGQYAIDGFELDQRSANEVLKNKIHKPDCGYSTGEFTVSSESDGQGLPFSFVDPVIKSIKKKKYSVSEEIVPEWQPYPGATGYTVQIYEKSEPYKFSSNTLFEWMKRPTVTEPRFDPEKFNTQFKAGKYYVLQVVALDNNGDSISETQDTFRGYDFAVIE